MRLLFALLLVLATAVATAGPAPAQEPYKIGAILSITGPGSSLRIPERDTAQMLEAPAASGSMTSSSPAGCWSTARSWRT